MDVAGLPGVANIRLGSLAAAPLLAPIDPNDGVVVADANGDLKKRDPSALGLAAANEPFLSFAPDAGSLPNNRVAVAGTGIGIAVGGADDGAFTINNAGVLSATGTANRVLVNGTTGAAQTGSITLSAPQDIHAGASPTFVNANLSGLPSGSSFTNLVVSNGGLLQTRTIGSLGSFWALGGNRPKASAIVCPTSAADPLVP